MVVRAVLSKFLPLHLVAVLLILIFPLSLQAQTKVGTGSYIVKFAAEAYANGNGKIDQPSVGNLGEVKPVGSGLYAVTVAPAAKASSSDAIRLEISDYNPDLVKAWCDAFKAQANRPIIYCEPDYYIQTDAVPSDSKYGSLWGMKKISATSAWDISTGSTNVVVAVTDTGVDYTHPDLAANMWKNPDEIPNNGIDDDGNGIVDDVYGYNAITESGNPMDDHSHGTHVAGTIGAVGNNSRGVVGVNWHVSIMAVKFLSASGGGFLSDGIQAIKYAVDNGANIINASWGGAGYSQALKDAIAYAKNKGVLFVTAAGNSASNNDNHGHYPSNYNLSNIISVAATDSNDNLASFSNYGSSSVHVAAPGVGILSTVPGGGYATFSGTSMASPHVAGLAALIKAVHPEFDYSQIKSVILNSGDKLATLNGLTITGRRINAASALGIDNPGSGDNASVHVRDLLGPGNRRRLLKSHRYTGKFSGEAGSSASVTMTFLDQDDGFLGECNLGQITLNSNGRARLRGRLSIVHAIRPIVSRVIFSANHKSAVLRRVGKGRSFRIIRRTRRAARIRSALSKEALAQAVSDTCERLKSRTNL
ncbi:MAG: hypothetical protein D6719_04455 [Candidatus Dadabacteria bacterium]|nr:MAG: hypothetical protein D6719_04455 [Candidatus Dadabacteria bacterium]